MSWTVNLSLVLMLALSGCEGEGPMHPEREPSPAVARLAMTGDAGVDGDTPLSDGGDEGPNEIPPGLYTFDEVKALLIAADPAFADALASVRSGPPPEGAAPAELVRAPDGPCELQVETPTDEIEPAPYVAPNWEREVDIFERVAAIPARDQVTLDEVRAGLAAAAAEGDDGAEPPTKEPHEGAANP